MSGPGLAESVGVHVKMHIVKNQGAMNLVKPSLNDKPLRLIPSDTIYMMESDEAIDLVICDVDHFYRNNSGSSLMWYYLAINGGRPAPSSHPPHDEQRAPCTCPGTCGSRPRAAVAAQATRRRGGGSPRWRSG